MRLATAILVGVCALVATLRAAEPKSSDPEKALRQFQLPAGFEGRVWAAEPLLHNPVSFAFDEKGRCFVAETYRLHHGVTDNPRHMYWLHRGVASPPVPDPVATE